MARWPAMIRMRAALLALPLFACSAAAPPAKPDEVGQALCRVGLRGIPMRTAKSGHHVAAVTVNGVAGTFVVDTGASGSVIHAPYAERFKLTRQPGPVKAFAVGAAGPTAAALMAPAAVTIGGVPIGNRRLISADLASVVGVLKQLAGEEVQGIIGQDVLREEHAVVDVRQSVLYLQGGNRQGC